MRRALLLLLPIWLCFGAAPALADRTLEEKLSAISTSIRAEPERAELYLRRADLYRQARRWSAALADAQRAAERDPALTDVHLVRGKVHADAGEPKKARAALDAFLALRPGDARGRLARAQVFVSLALVRAAVRDYDHALTGDPAPSPDTYLDRAALLTSLGPGAYREALKGLVNGLERLGPLISLELGALELERKLRSHEAALARLARLARDVPSMDGWNLRRAEVLLDAGRVADARAAYEAVARSVERLPASRRGTAAARSFLQAAADGLAALGARR